METGKLESNLVEYRESEILTTKHKIVDTTSAVNDLNHETTVELKQGIKNTVSWMRNRYNKS